MSTFRAVLIRVADTAPRFGLPMVPRQCVRPVPPEPLPLSQPVTIADLQELIGKPPAKQLPSNPYQKKNVNARMLDKMQGDKECYGWSCAQWARFLKCRPSSVVAAPAWKMLEKFRLQEKAERARDRRGRGTGRRKGDFGQN